jgi:hypothetical protein
VSYWGYPPDFGRPVNTWGERGQFDGRLSPEDEKAVREGRKVLVNPDWKPRKPRESTLL